MEVSPPSGFGPAALARRVLKVITFGGILASAGAIALMFYTGGLQQAKQASIKSITLIGGKIGQPNSLPPEARGKTVPGSRVFNEKNEFLGCLGPDSTSVVEDYCSH